MVDSFAKFESDEGSHTAGGHDVRERLFVDADMMSPSTFTPTMIRFARVDSSE